MINENLTSKRIPCINDATHRLEQLNIADARRNVEWMLCELLKCNRASLYAYPERNLPADVLTRLNTMLQRRMDGEPLQYILGYTDFFGLRIDVSPAVLIPRPETERLLERALTLMADTDRPCILDIGTGSGCIPIALKHNLPRAELHACDVSTEALDIANRNAKRHSLSVHFFSFDILAPHQEPPAAAPFNLITSNPPYIPDKEFYGLDREVRDHEPSLALITGPDPLVFYRNITVKSRSWLKKGGWVAFESHCDFANDVAGLLEQNGFEAIQVEHDLAGKPRIVYGRLAC